MKKTVLLISCLWATLAFAQKNEGIITYEQKINMHRRMPPEDEQMKAMVPEFQVHKVQLLFTPDQSLFKNVEEEEEDDAPASSGVVIKMQLPDNVLYRNFKEARIVESREFLQKQYLITDSLKGQAWKLSGESKTILGYSCLKATTSDTTRKQEITAWFTDAISCPSGPEGFNLLPGMILEVNINDGETVYTALNIEKRALKPSEIKPPTDGKPISAADFKKKVDDFMKENGGGRIRIIKN